MLALANDAPTRFLQRAEALKDTLRSGHTGQGRRESTAEHSWRLALLALLVARDRPELDPVRLLGLCLVHDLGEAVTGDVPAPTQRPGDDRADRERAGLALIAQELPDDLQAFLLDLYDDYTGVRSPEARLARGLDKCETILQHLAGDNPPGFDHGFNLHYGKDRTDADPLSAALRARIDAMTHQAIAARKD